MKRKRTYWIILLICCFFSQWGCGDKPSQKKPVFPIEAKTKAYLGREDKRISTDEIPETEQTIVESIAETAVEIPKEENGLLEVCAQEGMFIPSDIMIAPVLPKELVEGELQIYSRFRSDGWVFEWLVGSSYALVISPQNNVEDVQILTISGEAIGLGGWGISIENKFVYRDVNFDQQPDLLICSGQYGNQGYVTYYCFLQTDKGFREESSFQDIINPAVDTENKLILSQWRNWAASHSWAKYEYTEGVFKMDKVLTEEATQTESEQIGEVWLWTVNGEKIGRSDQLTDKEIQDLLYNEHSEWQLTDDRWRTLYNEGMMADFSIYADP